LDDWKHNAGAEVQIASKEEAEESEDDEEQAPPRENLPLYPIKRFR